MSCDGCGARTPCLRVARDGALDYAKLEAVQSPNAVTAHRAASGGGLRLTWWIGEVDLSDDELARELLAVQVAAYAIEAELLAYPQLPPLFETVDDLRGSGERFLAAKSEGRIVGATSIASSGSQLDICRMVVSPSHLRQGIASRLLVAVEGLRAGCAAITVSTGEDNIPAIRLYERHGFAIVKRRTLPDGLRLVGLEKRFDR